MKSGIFLVSLLASVAAAQPHRQHRHQHQARHQVIEWVTDWVVKTEVVAVTETVWVSEGYVAPTTLSTSASTTSSRKVPAQFFQPVSKSKSSSSPSSTTTPAPSTTSVVVVPPPVSTTTVEPVEPAAPVPSTTSVAEVSTSAAPAPSSEPVQAQVPEAKVEPVAAPVTTTSVAAVVAPTSATESSGSGPCSKGNGCTGDITHYDAGLGACGWETNGDSENVVALSHLLMGTQSNGNVYCGKTVTITLNGKSVTAKVVDKCMGCEHDDLDLSNKAFKELEDMGVGRTQASWHFN